MARRKRRRRGGLGEVKHPRVTRHMQRGHVGERRGSVHYVIRRSWKGKRGEFYSMACLRGGGRLPGVRQRATLRGKNRERCGYGFGPSPTAALKKALRQLAGRQL